MNIRIVRTSDLKGRPFVVLETVEEMFHHKPVYALRGRDEDGEFYLPIWNVAYKVVCKAMEDGKKPLFTVVENEKGVPYLKQITRNEAADLLKRLSEKKEK